MNNVERVVSFLKEANNVLVFTGAVGSRLSMVPTGDIVFQLLFQGVGSVVISGITFTQMIRSFGPVRSTMITALVPGLSALISKLACCSST